MTGEGEGGAVLTKVVTLLVACTCYPAGVRCEAQVAFAAPSLFPSSFSYARPPSIHHPLAGSRATLFGRHYQLPWLPPSTVFLDYVASPVGVLIWLS